MAPTPPPVPPSQAAVDVRDPRVLRAMAHPLRMTLLGLLRLEGPSTATRLGERVQESSGSTSYHLRQLAAHGFVEEVADQGTGRERWWRAVHRSTRWETSDFLDDPGAREVVEELTHRQVSQHRRLLAAHAEQRADLPEEWLAAVSLNDWHLRLSPARARALAEELDAVLARWRDAPEEPDQPQVHVLLDVLPLTEHPL
ncbi:MAG: Transcriptional regulator, ArsR family [uncultured Quadrisphaera sp.]|uniref:Transcriptional regulator, ArsR family n=1 Tax=uncultured Quadrisphaera sp. TaxID=904978 RepID=A0A6J4P3X6_9ACTN|nr:MAG: Transcriptional regulator, ArsR family [uncultured Quadrisphaera sp.]